MLTHDLPKRGVYYTQISQPVKGRYKCKQVFMVHDGSDTCSKNGDVENQRGGRGPMGEIIALCSPTAHPTRLHGARVKESINKQATQRPSHLPAGYFESNSI